jgi:hypothetical protein
MALCCCESSAALDSPTSSRLGSSFGSDCAWGVPVLKGRIEKKEKKEHEKFNCRPEWKETLYKRWTSLKSASDPSIPSLRHASAITTRIVIRCTAGTTCASKKTQFHFRARSRSPHRQTASISRQRLAGPILQMTRKRTKKKKAMTKSPNKIKENQTRQQKKETQQQ